MEQQLQKRQFYNPFAVRVGQVMTGFGIGCGVGIGLGHPLNLGSIPVVDQMAGQATKLFGPASRQLHGLVRKLGIKNLEMGVGCGVGLGHGFGIGITLKPGVAERLKLLIEQAVGPLIIRIRSGGEHSSNLEGQTATISSASYSSKEKLMVDDAASTQISQTGAMHKAVQSTSSVSNKIDTEVASLSVENRILRTLLTHQEQIEELKQQNANLQNLLERELSLSKELKSSSSSEHTKEYGQDVRLSTKCWKCRRLAQQRPSVWFSLFMYLFLCITQ